MPCAVASTSSGMQEAKVSDYGPNLPVTALESAWAHCMGTEWIACPRAHSEFIYTASDCSLRLPVSPLQGKFRSAVHLRFKVPCGQPSNAKSTLTGTSIAINLVLSLCILVGSIDGPDEEKACIYWKPSNIPLCKWGPYSQTPLNRCGCSPKNTSLPSSSAAISYHTMEADTISKAKLYKRTGIVTCMTDWPDRRVTHPVDL